MHLDYYWFKKLFKGEKFDIKAERVFFADALQSGKLKLIVYGLM